MKRIAIINFYFGNKKPEYMDYYISSCAYNSDIDFYIFTDLDLHYENANIHIHKMKFKEFATIISTKIKSALEAKGISENVVIRHPYKIADYRPTFGLCLEEWLKDYDFWGYCDLDLIFGDIRRYLTDELMDKYDKLYEHGHFSIIRNTKECNERFLEDYRNSFYSVIHMEKNSFFEEVYEKKWLPHGGVNSIFDRVGSLYKNRKALCDISFKYNNLIDLKNPSNSNRNVFVFEEGKLYRVTLSGKNIMKEEVFYVHFQKRKMSGQTDDFKKFYADNDSFRAYNKIDKNLFVRTPRFNMYTKKWIKFRYIDAIKRKINNDFLVK